MKTILYSKEGLLFLIQVDHLNGETIGSVIESFYEAGAKNVQVVSAITKKNRPSYMVFVDAREKDADAIERVIVDECGSSGWHRIETCHRHTNVSILKKNITIHTARATYEFQVEGKVINDDTVNARPEYENCASLKKLLQEKEGISIPLRKLTGYIAEVFHEDKREITI